jgi:hypothetical protein
MTHQLAVDEDKTDWLTCAFTAEDVDDATFHTPQKLRRPHLGKRTKCVETDMKQCQGNSLFLLPTTQKFHNSIENVSKDTQLVYTRNSLREAKRI